jgi:hypothetical protein
MITEFLDTETVSDHDHFQAWRTQHQDGVVLMLEAGSRGRLHGVRCTHFGSGPPYFSSDDGFGSLTSKRKLCGSERELVEWAIENGIKVKRCQHCVRDGLVGAGDVENDLDAQVAEAEAVIVDAIPDQQERALVLRRLASSAAIADAIAPAAWGVTLFTDGFRLNVGQVEVLVLREGTLRVNLSAELGVPPFVEPLFVAATYHSMPKPQCAFVGTIHDYVDVEAAIRDAHEGFVRIAASTRSGEAREGTPFRRSHNEGLVEFARRTLGDVKPAASETPTTRTDYVVYHSSAVMGYPYTPDPNGRVAFFTNKPESVVRRALGSVVWIFSGEQAKGKTRYHLHGKFKPNSIVELDDAREISGSGTFPPGPIDVTDQPWFRDLLAEQANFSLGLNRIRSGSVLLALDAIFQGDATPPSSRETLPEEISEGSYREGQGVQITVNRYERDASARAACLNHFGPSCQICRVDLSTVYGPIADGLVHVHHLRPLSQITGEYEVRPDQDLIPVCPNCHAVVHRHDPPLTPDQVREMISQTGSGKA